MKWPADDRAGSTREAAFHRTIPSISRPNRWVHVVPSSMKNRRRWKQQENPFQARHAGIADRPAQPPWRFLFEGLSILHAIIPPSPSPLFSQTISLVLFSVAVGQSIADRMKPRSPSFTSTSASGWWRAASNTAASLFYSLDTSFSYIPYLS